jgi:hypothetical protein
MIDRIREPWGGRTPFGPGEEWPVRVDRFLEEGVSEDEVDRWVLLPATIRLASSSSPKSRISSTGGPSLR